MKHTDYQIIGKITGTHGKHGDLKVFPITADETRFLDLEHCFIEDGKELVEWIVNGARLHKGNALLSVDGIEERAAALLLNGKHVFVPKSERIVLEEGQYFLDDLIGCEVREVSEGLSEKEESGSEAALDSSEGSTDAKAKDESFLRGGKIGKVADYLDHCGNGLLSISLTNGKTMDMPFVDVYVADVQIDNKLVLVTLRWRDLLDLT